MNERPAPQGHRIYPGISGTQYPSYTSTYWRRSLASENGENFWSSAAHTVKFPRSNMNQWDVPKLSRSRGHMRSNVLRPSNAPDNQSSVNFTLDESLVSELQRPATILPSRKPSPHRAKRRTEPPISRSGYAHGSIRPSSKKPDTRLDEPRYPQGHRNRSSTSKPSAPQIQPECATKRDLSTHAEETATAISNLNLRVDLLNNTVAVVLPIVAEARLLWMENTVVRAPTKLGTTRQAFCQYYDNLRYLAYTASVRARAYQLGLTPHDLRYLQERFLALAEEHTDRRKARETVLLGLFGGGNEAGDRAMVESFHPESRHGVYARRIWRLCYERAFSVDPEWSIPVPEPDSSNLMTKIKTWLGTE